MTSPQLEPCECGCGLQLLPEDAAKVREQIEAARAAGQPEPRHRSGVAQPENKPEPVSLPEASETAAPKAAELTEPELYEREQLRRRKLALQGGLEGSAARLAHVESRPDHMAGL